MGIHVTRPGMLSTVQDLGRWGFQNLGVPVAGPMDRCSHRFANVLVGNPAGAATLEITLIGPELVFEQATRVAVTGAEFDLVLDGRTMPMNESVPVPAGSNLRFRERRRGARAYLAAAGGFDVPELLGSRSTHLPSRFGGLAGRALAAGDVLRLRPVGEKQMKPVRRQGFPLELPQGGARVRVMLGPQDNLCAPSGIKTFCTSRYAISARSDRMGYCLTGPPVELVSSAGTLSDATPTGTVQVPGSGQPMILMADGQTTGGYPKLAIVITADLPLVGQLSPGDWLEFEVCDRAVALRALIAQERTQLV